MEKKFIQSLGRAIDILEYLALNPKARLQDISTSLNGEKTIAELREVGYNDVYFIECNVANDDDMKKAYEFSKEKLGGIDCVINNAGIWHGGMLHETSDEEWDRLFNIDVKSIYLSTKYFVPDMIKRKFGIRVNNVCPSACATPMFLTNQDPKVIELFEKASALGRLCTPEDIAAAMYFLASDKSSFITGINLPVSGGMVIHTGQPIQEDR